MTTTSKQTHFLCIFNLLRLGTINILLHSFLLWHIYKLTESKQSYPSRHSKHSISLSPIHNHKKIQHTVNEKIPGAGMLQSPIVACLNNEYPESLSSFDTVLAGCHERTNSAVSLNFFYQLSPIFNNIPLIQTLDSLVDRNNENLDFNKHTMVQNPILVQ